ncbi:MAG: FG-GAP repeat domain-containing protein [Terriglobia bacterium]
MQEAQAPVPLPNPQVEVIEDISESLAYDLLDLSVLVRARDLPSVATFIADPIRATPLPTNPEPAEPLLKWIHQHGWKPTIATPQRMSRQEFLQGLEDLLGHFSEIEDARFKVKEAHFDEPAGVVPEAKVPTATVGSHGQARIAFYVIGRNMNGQREWLRGMAHTRVRRAENRRWEFEAFTLASLKSMVATTDLFSEVAVPAGVAATRPAYGSPDNTGFVWYGAAAADWDNDGWIDLFVAGPDHNFLYLNDGQGRFRDASEAVGLSFVNSGVAPVALDYDNDGDQDVFVSAVGAQILLENRLLPDGKLKFRDVSVQAGVAVVALGFSAVAGDVNADGRPDIYVTCYNRYGQVVPDSWFRATNGTPNLLFINQGDGTFREEAAKWSVDDRRWSYAAAFADVNGDGRLDLYVANDFGENALFINQGDRFADEASARAVLDPGFGMGVSFGDCNNDGVLDLHVTNMSSTAGNRILSRLFPAASPEDNVLKKLAAGNCLYQNKGGGYFRDVTAEAGRFSGGWAWGGGFLDFDNDGWEDLFTPNGFVSGKSMRDT